MNFSEINKEAWDCNNPKGILVLYYNYLRKFEGVSIVNVCGSRGKINFYMLSDQRRKNVD